MARFSRNFLLVLGLAPTSLGAQQPRDSVRLAELVVTATRDAVPARVRATVADIVDQNERSRRQLFRLSDVLRLLPGSTMVGTGALGGATSTFFRGVNSNQTLLLIDGIRVNDANADPGALLGGFELVPGDRLEVAHGPQSTAFGGASIGGIIAVSSAIPREGSTLSAVTEGGSFGTYHGVAAGGVRSGRFGVTGSFGLVGSDNQRPHNGYDQRIQQLKLEYQAANRLTIGGTIRGLQQSFVSPGDIRTSNTTPVGTTDFDHTLGTVFAEAQPTSSWSSRLTLGGQDYFLRGSSQFDGGDPFISKLAVTRWVIDWQHRVAPSRHVAVIAGVNAEWSDVTDNDGLKEERLRAGYGELVVSPTDDLELTVGGRYDDYTTFGSRATGRVAVGYFLAGPQLKLRATFGTGFLPPSLAARYGSAFQKPNGDLRPERSRGLDFGVDRFFASGRGVVSVTLFGNDLIDLIGFESAPFPELGRSVNINRARTRGVEVAARAETGPLDSRISYTFLSAENLSETDADLRRLIRRPRHAIAADFSYRRGPMTLGVGATGAFDREDSDFNQFPAARVNPGDYVDARIATSWRLSSMIGVEGRVENVFGTRYEEAYGFPSLGRRFTIGLRFDRSR